MQVGVRQFALVVLSARRSMFGNRDSKHGNRNSMLPQHGSAPVLLLSFLLPQSLSGSASVVLPCILHAALKMPPRCLQTLTFLLLLPPVLFAPLCFRSFQRFNVLYLTLLLYCPPELPLRVMMSCLVLKSFLYCPLRLPLWSAVPSSLVLKSLVYCPPEIVACTIAACERERERETAVLRTKTAQSKKEPAERPAAGEPASQRGARTKEKDRGHTGCRWPGSGPYLLSFGFNCKKTPHRHRESKLR